MPTRPRTRPAPAKQDDGLKLDDAHAIAILDKAVEYEVIDEDKVPDNKKQRIAFASEQVDLLIEAWTKSGISPYSDEPEKAEMGGAIQDILDIAGVEIDEENNVSFGELPDLDEEEQEAEAEADNEDGEEGDGEAAVDINDIIDGYDDLSAAGKVKAIEKLELDMEDDDDYNRAVMIYEYEEAQEKPSSRVLSWLDDLLPQEGEGGGEPEAEEDEDAEAAGDGEGEAGEWEQPWTKADGAPNDYDRMSAVDVKKYLDKMLAKEELSTELLEYVRDYEQARDKPPTRSRVINHVKALMAQFEGGEEPEAEEEAPARSGRPVNARRQREGRSLRGAVQQEEEEADEEQAEGAIYIVTVNGSEPYTAYGLFQAAGIVADLLADGNESVTVTAE